LGSLREHRKRIRKLLKESPSLQLYLTEIIDECYQEAREDAVYETGLSTDTFPTESPFTLEETLSLDYLPD
jgi:hypothetical protein